MTAPLFHPHVIDVCPGIRLLRHRAVRPAQQFQQLRHTLHTGMLTAIGEPFLNQTGAAALVLHQSVGRTPFDRLFHGDATVRHNLVERSVLFQKALQIVERLLREVPHLCDILPANAVDHVLRSCIILRFDESGNLLLGIGAVFQLRIAEHRVQLAGQLLAVFLGVVCDLLLQCLQQGDIEAEIAGVQGDVIPHISTVGNGGLNAADVRDSAVALRQFQFVLEVLMQPQDLLLRQIHAAAIEGVLAVLCHSIQSHFYSILLNEPCGAQIALGTILAEDLVHPMFQRRKLGCGVLFNTGEHVEFRQPTSLT